MGLDNSGGLEDLEEGGAARNTTSEMLEVVRNTTSEMLETVRNTSSEGNDTDLQEKFEDELSQAFGFWIEGVAVPLIAVFGIAGKIVQTT